MPVMGQAIHKQPETVTNDALHCKERFMNPLLIGNAVSMIGCLIMVAIGFLKKKSHILIAQSVQCLFMGVGNLTLGGVSGFICNVVTIIRNLVFLKFRNTTFLKIFFILLQLVLSFSSFTAGLISWLPLIAAALFTWFMDTKSEVKLKIVILCTQVMWLTYDLYYLNYVASAFDVMTFISNCIGLSMILKKNK